MESFVSSKAVGIKTQKRGHKNELKKLTCASISPPPLPPPLWTRSTVFLETDTDDRLDAYYIGGGSKVPENSVYLGCYEDHQQGRALDASFVWCDGKMTVPVSQFIHATSTLYCSFIGPCRADDCTAESLYGGIWRPP